jgi:hypothetical protein
MIVFKVRTVIVRYRNDKNAAFDPSPIALSGEADFYIMLLVSN